MPQTLVVFDLGKTNAKLVVLDETGQIIWQKSKANTVVQTGLYPHADTTKLWQWLLTCLLEIKTLQPKAIMVVAHGATAALLAGNDLILPVLDYEAPLEGILKYPRPDFLETASPDLPNGLNLGRQLYWQQQQFPQAFAKVDTILLYPQFWAFKLSKIKASEVSSLGCHTDLWNPYKQEFSSLVLQQDWLDKFPPIYSAWQVLGRLEPQLVEQLGYDCDVYCGVHDSNASLVPYLKTPNSSVVSTGTWIISMVLGGQTQTLLEQRTPNLLEQRDMLCNSNVLGQIVPTARFMGGREFETILETTQPVLSTWNDLEFVLQEQIFVIPEATLRYIPSRPEQPQERYALASLYVALRIDLQLTWLASKSVIFLEGSVVQNPFIAALLAALRPDQTVFISSQSTGTTQGAFLLANWQNPPQRLPRQAVMAAGLTGLAGYKQHWLELLPAEWQ
jgi:L-fuculokinase